MLSLIEIGQVLLEKKIFKFRQCVSRNIGKLYVKRKNLAVGAAPKGVKDVSTCKVLYTSLIC